MLNNKILWICFQDMWNCKTKEKIIEKNNLKQWLYYFMSVWMILILYSTSYKMIFHIFLGHNVHNLEYFYKCKEIFSCNKLICFFFIYNTISGQSLFSKIAYFFVRKFNYNNICSFGFKQNILVFLIGILMHLPNVGFNFMNVYSSLLRGGGRNHFTHFGWSDGSFTWAISNKSSLKIKENISM